MSVKCLCDIGVFGSYTQAPCRSAPPAGARTPLTPGSAGRAARSSPKLAPARDVRKTVTVVFCDVTGSTALGEQLDPESLRRVMARYFDEMQAVVERHEGIVEKFIGDAVMAVFGVPVLHEDDALRAVRAAAEMRRASRGAERRARTRLGHPHPGADRRQHGRGRRRRRRRRRATVCDRRRGQRRQALRGGGTRGRDPPRRADLPARPRRRRSRARRSARAQGQGGARACLPATRSRVRRGGTCPAPRLADGRARA